MGEVNHLKDEIFQKELSLKEEMHQKELALKEKMHQNELALNDLRHIRSENTNLRAHMHTLQSKADILQQQLNHFKMLSEPDFGMAYCTMSQWY